MPTFEKLKTYFFIDKKKNVNAQYCALLVNKKDESDILLVRIEKHATLDKNVRPYVEINCITNPAFQNYELRLLPSVKKDKTMQREILYVSGSAGSGKSYLANKYAEIYHHIFPTRKIYYLSTNPMADKDRSLTHNLYQKIDVPKFLEQSAEIVKQNYEFFENALFIFDDIDNLENAPKKQIYQIINNIATNFRKGNTSMILLQHLETDYRLTRTILKEMDIYVFFPSLITQNNRVLKAYLMMNNNQVDKLHTLPCRKDEKLWVAIHKNFEVVITPNQCFPIYLL